MTDNHINLTYKKDLFERTLHLNNIMVFHQDLNLRFTWVSNPLEIYNQKDLLGKTEHELLAESTANQLIFLKKQLLKTHKPKRGNIYIQDKDQEIVFELFVEPVIDAETREMSAIAGYLKDISYHKQVLKELHENQQRTKLMMQILPGMVFTQDLDLKYTWANNATKNYYHGEILGKTDFYLFPENIAEKLAKIKQKVISSGSTLTERIIIPGMDHEGKDQIMDVIINPLYDANRKTFGITGIYQDVTQQNKAEEELANERELLMTILESIPVMLTLYEPSINLQYFNQAFHKITGWTPEDIKNNDPMELVYPHPEYRAEILSYMQSLKPGFRDIIMKAKDGRTLDTSWANIKLPDGRQVGIGVDITERKQAEQVLRESEERFHSAFRISPDTLMISELESGRILNVNDTWTKHWGYTREESIGSCVTRMDVYLNLEDRRKAIEVVKQNGSLHNYNIELKTKAGNIRQVVMAMELMNLPDKKLILTIIRDITEQKRSEQERERLLEENTSQKGFLETLLNSIKAGIAVLSGDEPSFIMVNKAYQDLRPEVSMQGRKLSEVFPEINKTEIKKIIKEVLNSGISHETTGVSLPIKGKPDAVWDHQIARLPLAEGNIPSVLHIIWDTTSHKRMQVDLKKFTENLENANRDLESFTYSVSHDLRTPLLTVASFSHLLREDYSPQLDDEGKDYIRRIESGVKKMQQIIDDMLILSRSGRKQIEYTHMDLSQMVRATLNELKKHEPERKTEFIIQEKVLVNADLGLMKLAIENLLGNAWKFTSKKPVAVIEFGSIIHKNILTYFIKDNGEGFSDMYYQKMFEPFKRLHSEHEFEGSGIGLSIVQRVIKRHDGKIWAEGKPGKGATFYFTI